MQKILGAEGIQELSEKYNIPEWAVRDEVEKTVSAILTHRLRCEVEAVLSDTLEFQLFGFTDKGDYIPLASGNVKKRLIREIKWRISKNLLTRSVLDAYERYRNRAQTLVYGRIAKQVNGNLFIDIADMPGNNVVAVCGLSSQTPKERGKLAEEILPFYVLSIRPVSNNGIPCVEIRLSRNARGLVEELFREELREKTLDIQVKCVKRIAGAYSIVNVASKIPQECIKRVSDMVKERMIVSYPRLMEVSASGR